MLVFILICATCTFAAASLGYDLSVAADPEVFECLINDNKAEYGIVRVYRNLGQVDSNSAATIISGSSAGLKNIDGYMFPCAANSPYSVANNITCDDAATQVSKTLKYLSRNGVGVLNSSVQPTPYFPLLATIGRMWIDIEDEVPSKYFSPTIADNTQLMADLVSSLQDYGIEVGVYTTKTYWQNIMGNVEGYGQLKLWYPKYDDTNNMLFARDVLPFADFTKVFIKQTQGNVGVCGLSQVDSNYSEKAPAPVTDDDDGDDDDNDSGSDDDNVVNPEPTPAPTSLPSSA